MQSGGLAIWVFLYTSLYSNKLAYQLYGNIILCGN